MLERVVGEGLSVGTAEECGSGSGGPLCQVGRHHADRRAGQGCEALAASLAGAGDVGAGAEVEVSDGQGADLADAKPGLYG